MSIHMKRYLASLCAFMLLTLPMQATAANTDVTIKLKSTAISVQGNGVTVDGTTATITEAGTYRITGALENGCILVDAGKEAKVTLVLDGVHITNHTGPCIYVTGADKVIVDLEKGSVNTLQSGEEGNIISEDVSGGVLQSKDDLKIKGSGQLTVLGYLNNGIQCSNDLEITKGKLNITAANDGIRGKDSITVSGGEITIISGGDGMETDGVLTMKDGSVNVTAGGGHTEIPVSGNHDDRRNGWGRGSFDSQASGQTDDTPSRKGLKAGSELVLAGGTLSLDTADDALHTNGTLTISGGEISVSTSDDGLHADDSLTIQDGRIRVEYSKEGIEAKTILLGGGDVYVFATDDGINASDGSDTNTFSRNMRGGFDNGRNGRGMQPPIDGSQPTPPDNMQPAMDGSQPTLPDNIQPAMDGSQPTPPDNMQPPTDEPRDQSPNNMQPASASERPALRITGGKLVIIASSDGLDANGSISIEGGQIIASGSYTYMDAPVDYDDTASLTGGTLLLLGGESAGFTTAEQCSFFVQLNETVSAGETFTVTDSNDKVIWSVRLPCESSGFLFSDAALSIGEVYTVTIGSQSVTVEQTAQTVGQTGQNFNFGGGRGGFNGDGKGGRHGW